jgi:hypothetical protein
MKSELCGYGEGHCCWFGTVCEHLEETTNERRWSCKLKEKYGTWDEVYGSPEWPGVLANAMAVGLPVTYKCGDWPTKGERCGECGVIG